MCMETGQQLVLMGHERVYGSLYDMLNQSYSSSESMARNAAAPWHYVQIWHRFGITRGGATSSALKALRRHGGRLAFWAGMA